MAARGGGGEREGGEREDCTRLGGKRLGTSTSFVDASSGEVILRVAFDSGGSLQLSFRLYDARGQLIAEADGLEHSPQGLCVRVADGELLLEVPGDQSESIQYRLYNREGRLLTQSDGSRTKIYPGLRMEGSRNGAKC